MSLIDARFALELITLLSMYGVPVIVSSYLIHLGLQLRPNGMIPALLLGLILVSLFIVLATFLFVFGVSVVARLSMLEV